MLSISQNQDVQVEILREIADAYYGTIVVTDQDACVLYVNQKACDKYGVSEDRVLGRPLGDFFQQGPFNNCAVLKTIKTKKAEIQYEKNCMDSPAIVFAFPLFDQDRQLRRIVSFSQDVDMPLALVEKINTEWRTAVSAIDYLNSASQKNALVAESDAMKKLVVFLKQIASYDITVSLYGESGVGKEICARFIHQHSNRAKRVFLPFNCATMPKELIESELFGYASGAFTGARKEGKAGLFEIANNGTLFLDEVGELPLSVQSKLLRTIETGEYRKLGGETVHYSDMRLITATNRDLEKMVASGDFREDLYYRINILPITVPPLRDRIDDIIPLALTFLNVANQKFGKRKYMTPGTLESLKKYPWPGNVRELRNIVEQLYVSSSKDAISFRDSFILPYIMRRIEAASPFPEKTPANGTAVTAGPGPAAAEKSMRQALKDFEREYLEKVLLANHYNISQTAEKLGLHRSVVYRKMEEHGITVPPTENRS